MKAVRGMLMGIAVILSACSSSKVVEVREYPVKITNLGAIVNSSADDISPTVTANGTTLIFASDREGKGAQGKRDFWISTFDGNFWSPPENMGPPVNSPRNEGSPSISSDGQTIYFARSDPEMVGPRVDIYSAVRKGKGWDEVQNLGPPVSTNAWESHPSISSDGKTLYFVSDRKGGRGGLDIWKAEKDAQGKWAAVTNLGPTINTPGDETSPFIASDGKTLYFSSDGHPGLGGSDMFVSRFVNGAWLKPVNLGRPLNSPENDEFYSLAAAGNVVYFASPRKGGFGGYDVYRAEPNPFPPGAVMVLSGTVRDKKTKSPLGATLTLRDLGSGREISAQKSNEYSGEYLVVLPAGTRYELAASAQGYLRERAEFDLTTREVYEELKKDFLLGKDEPAPKLAASVTADVLTSDFSILRARDTDAPGLTIEEVVYREFVPLLPYVFFDQGSAAIPSRYIALRPDQTASFDGSLRGAETLERYRNLLNIIGRRLRQKESVRVTLSGCNDNTGAERGNTRLSDQRAAAVRDYFVHVWGIDPARIGVEAHGLPANKSTSATEEGRAENRRVEIAASDPLLLDPLEINDVQRALKPPSLLLNLSIEAQAGLKQWNLGIRQKERELRASDGYSSYPDSIRWDWRDREGNLPAGDEPLLVTLKAVDNTGAETEAAPQTIPVRFITLEKKNVENLPDRTIEKASLILFDFDRSEIGARNRQLLDNVGRAIAPRSTVLLRGYTDASGDDAYNLQLSERRAAAAAGVLTANMPEMNLRHEGKGESVLLYPNDTPEGRFYCRTVQVLIETPRR